PAPAGGAVRRVLLLNVTYEPLTTVGLRRAVCLVLGGKAEVVHDDAAGALLHAASVVLATPSVIRLSRYVRIPYRNRVPLTRAPATSGPIMCVSPVLLELPGEVYGNAAGNFHRRTRGVPRHGAGLHREGDHAPPRAVGAGRDRVP